MNNTPHHQLHVIFGTGPIGMAVMETLLVQGARIRMVNRNGRGNVPEGVEVRGGDAADPIFTRQVCAGATVVYNALNPPYYRWPELFPGLQAGVLEGVSGTGAKLVAMENLYMYGPTARQPLTENLPYAAATRKGAVRASMSRELMEAHASGRARVTIGRASDFFGPRVLASAAGAQVFGRAVKGRSAQVIGDPDQPHTYTYAPDIGRGLVILGQHEEALGRAWHLPSPKTVTTRELVGMTFAEMDAPARMQVAPKLLLRALGLFNPPVRETIEMLYEFDEPFVVDHSDFTHAFGDHSTPWDEAIRQTVHWYREYHPSARM